MTAAQQSTFSFVHAADLHLDTPFKGIHEVAPHVADTLREASLETFDAIVDLAVARKVAFVLIAGDVYDGAERGLRAQLRFRKGLQRLADADIQSFVVHGNHDPVTEGWSAIGGGWPNATTVFGPEDVTIIPVERDGVEVATVQGISYAKRATTENLARRFARPDRPGFHIGLLHCNVQGSPAGYDNYSPCTLDDLKATGLDYLALGHIHQRRILSGRPGERDPWVVYPGNIQARSSRHGEQEPKGVVLVEVTNDRVTEVEFVACDRVRFVDASLSIVDVADLAVLEDRLLGIAAEQLEHARGRSVVIRARLTGRGGLHRDLARPSTIDELVRRMREITGNTAPFCWWDEIVDETALEIDLAALLGRGDFLADLIETSGRIADDPDAKAAILDGLLAEVPRTFTTRLEGLLEDGDRLTALVDQAMRLALDALGIAEQ